MSRVSRRSFLELSVAFGATAVWGGSVAKPSTVRWSERRELSPEGVASGGALFNPDLSHHVSFADMGGHEYSIVRVIGEEIETEFVCIPRPLERSESATADR